MRNVTWDLRKLQKYLDKKPPGSLYLVYGDDGYLVDEALKLIKNKSFPEGNDDFSYDHFFYPDTSPSQVRDAVETLTILSPRRVVVYKIGSGLKDKEWDDLYPVLEHPVTSTTFMVVIEKVDKRKKYYRLFAEKGTLVELKKPFESQLPAWMEYMALSHQIQLNEGAMRLLHQFVGNNLAEMNNEMLKLAQYLGDERRVVNENDVIHLVSRSRIDSVFDLTNAIGRKDRVHALICLANLLEHGQNEIGALSLITRHVRILYQVCLGVRDGLTGVKLSSKAGVPPFFLQEYVNQSRTWSLGKLNQTLRVLHETDRALKSSTLSSHIWLENFIIQTCS